MRRANWLAPPDPALALALFLVLVLVPVIHFLSLAFALNVSLGCHSAFDEYLPRIQGAGAQMNEKQAAGMGRMYAKCREKKWGSNLKESIIKRGLKNTDIIWKELFKN